MAAKDIFHDTVKRALVKEEWQNESYRMLVNDDMFLEILNELGIKFILFDPINEKITSWIN